jgi:hypothetical protein
MKPDTEDTTNHPDFIEGFEGILESENERRKMTSAQLAIRLSKCEKDSPAYILLSHELDRRLGHEQIRSTRFAAYMGLIGVIIGTMLQPVGAALLEIYQSHTHTMPVSPASISCCTSKNQTSFTSLKTLRTTPSTVSATAEP